MLIARGPAPAALPLGVIMYGRLIRSTTLISAHSTTGHRAVCSTMPRHESRTPPGWNHRRDSHHISVDASTTGVKYTKNRPTGTDAIGRSTSSATAGSGHKRASETDHSVYQLWQNRNCTACPRVYRRISRGV